MKSKEFLKDVIPFAYTDMAIQALSFRYGKTLAAIYLAWGLLLPI
jgi:hypothetical protein